MTDFNSFPKPSFVKKKTKILVGLASILMIMPLIYNNCGQMEQEIGYSEDSTIESKEFDLPEASTETALTCLQGGVPAPCKIVVDTGMYFSCAMVSGGVRCWGDNKTGQLGQGNVSGYVTVPTSVLGLSNVTALSTGQTHVCVVSNGQVKCWGSNAYGQIGNGTSGNAPVLAPYTIPGLTNVVDVTAGRDFTCALNNTNRVYCWGRNQYGQFGNGTTTSSLTPVQITALNGTTMISAGTYNVCAIVGTQARCWGRNNFGQVGNGTTSAFVATPFSIPSLPNVISISSGNDHSCAVTSTGSARCWGRNNFGQVGNGSTVTQTNPVQVAGLSTGVSSISTGGDVSTSIGNNYTCATMSTGAAKCWGWNNFGQLGNGSYSQVNSTPQNVSGLTAVSQISAGFTHSCVVTATYAPYSNVNVKCFGQGLNGALGNGSTADQNIPVNAIANQSCCGLGQTSLVNAPSPRMFSASNSNNIWTGSKMIIWGGSDGAYTSAFGDGGMYDPATNSWTSINTAGAPSARMDHSAIWTGSALNKMIVWGGRGSGLIFSPVGDGKIYNTTNNTWTPMSNINAPVARHNFSSVWTGTEMIVWGGAGQNYTLLGNGGRYNPVTNTWAPISNVNAPSARYFAKAVWAGPPVNKLVLWGGQDAYAGNSPLNDGKIYDPVSDSWSPMSNINAPSVRASHSMVWTGTEMIVWGGRGPFGNHLGDGARYNPLTNTWAPIATAPMVGASHAAIWTGPPMNKMIVLAGLNGGSNASIYNADTNSWEPFCSLPLYYPLYTSMIWTGTQVIAWGGSSLGFIGAITNSGLIYTP